LLHPCKEAFNRDDFRPLAYDLAQFTMTFVDRTGDAPPIFPLAFGDLPRSAIPDGEFLPSVLLPRSLQQSLARRPQWPQRWPQVVLTEEDLLSCHCATQSALP
jgi:hypothetical protein